MHEKTVNSIIRLNQALGSPREVQDQCWNELVLSDDGKSPCRCLHESVVFCAQWKQHSGFQVTPGQLPHPQLRLKYLLTEFGLPVTKQLQDVCLKLSPSDNLVAAIHKAMVRPAASRSLRGCQFGPCQKMNRTENEEFARDGTDLKLMLKRCSGH